MVVPPASAPLSEVAAALAAPGKGLLAADESVGTIGKRLEKAGLVNDEVNVVHSGITCSAWDRTAQQHSSSCVPDRRSALYERFNQCSCEHHVSPQVCMGRML